MHLTPKPGTPEFVPVTPLILRTALQRSAADMKRAPIFAVGIASIYVLLGWFMAWVTHASGQTYWLVLAAVGFPLFSPFAAIGFYDVSRRFSRGMTMNWRATLSVILQQSKRQLPSLCAIIVMIFLFWFFLAHMIFALFLGLSTMTHVSSSLDVFFTSNGLMMLSFGTAVGACFAALLYMLTVLALPLLLDREVDFITAMITSFTYVQRFPLLMFSWAAFIASITFVAMIPGFLGLFIALPLLGHATWHLYDQLIDKDT
ncbi:Uncharacterized membrane protein [Epibacterium ulvae]|uniref:Uncharacterized membrane protein n=1 Tax=Epibacterium ulvae TaxID=1156985 RepID=A0A1G5PKA1_9RHOB|nr:DUF2189 domain-containing protein [Epibacterium ulvae]SCZ49479.1 Uncharacterized membrane protein [Epibacterium ulvae]